MNSLSGLVLPSGYRWLLDRALVGYEPFTQLQPWHYLPLEQCFWASDRWPGVTNKRLLAFAKRQDCDDLACFVAAGNNTIQGIALIHGWTASGYDFYQEFDDFWAWLKHVVDDIAGWVNAGE
ncbi:hypothetical protein HI806_14535 [Ralstonia solanacearum]|uniref:hypothetical protein n=1 Tax=Ralstonia pseudosolanacearum TaxID=1310165 RepID=UPI00090332ED|nr:hypothetical protein [Ralstonia pseudosolanacearum]QIK22936.1 hypothetical protein G7939_05630 [Ralstonia solanacearum]MCK4145036.1 hypothetical protein [Ralstonia pseudosolanacearum]QIK29025.1 hypothetical protein G7947_12200 [Ralstonia solanacearum]QIK33933.1 hypothetical protein G7969_12200 [Ralstonia solanacearum]QKL72379.1 hypothetical protein HI806_14535 [Ralstonia solanacearum]